MLTLVIICATKNSGIVLENRLRGALTAKFKTVLVWERIDLYKLHGLQNFSVVVQERVKITIEMERFLRLRKPLMWLNEQTIWQEPI
jgi:hypothetical protein